MAAEEQTACEKPAVEAVEAAVAAEVEAAAAEAAETKGSDLSRAFSEDGALKTHVGGQALLEGVMMRGKYNWSAAVRLPDGGMYTEEHDLVSGRQKHAWMRLPIIRGCVSFVESLVLGYKALDVASQHAYDEDGYSYFSMPQKADDLAKWEAKQAEKAAKAAAKAAKRGGAAAESPNATAEKPALSEAQNGSGEVAGEGVVETVSQGEAAAAEEPKSFMDSNITTISMVIGLVLGVALFIIIPAVLTNLIVGEYDAHTLVWNLVDGLLRVVVFVGYIWLIGRMPDIDHMFGYHGAEHKTIHCYEHGLELTPENARRFPRLHVRCGTAFLIMVMVIAILVYTILPVKALITAWGVPDGVLKLILVIAIRILFLPLIAGISFEITVKWAGSHPDNPLVKVILWPGMQMQYLTTREPDDTQLECAIAAMKLVLEREEREAAAAADRGETAAPEPQAGCCQ